MLNAYEINQKIADSIQQLINDGFKINPDKSLSETSDTRFIAALDKRFDSKTITHIITSQPHGKRYIVSYETRVNDKVVDCSTHVYHSLGDGLFDEPVVSKNDVAHKTDNRVKELSKQLRLVNDSTDRLYNLFDEYRKRNRTHKEHSKDCMTINDIYRALFN